MNKTRRKENAFNGKYVEEDEVEEEDEAKEETLDLKEGKVKRKEEANLYSTNVSTSFTINTVDFTSPAPYCSNHK